MLKQMDHLQLSCRNSTYRRWKMNRRSYLALGLSIGLCNLVPQSRNNTLSPIRAATLLHERAKAYKTFVRINRPKSAGRARSQRDLDPVLDRLLRFP